MTDLKTVFTIALQTQGEERAAKLRQALLDLGVSADKAEQLASGLDTELSDIANSSGAAERKTLNFVGALKTMAAAAVVREFFQINSSIEAMSKTLEMVTGSQAGAREEMAFVRTEASRLGIDVGAAAQSYISLAAAAKGTILEGQATRDLWSSLAGAMAALGKSSADVEGAVTQLSQGISKGKFELEDLKGIAERIPGFFNLFASALGVTTAQLMDMISAGQITADKLPALASALAQVSGDTETFNARLSRLWNGMKEGAVTLNEILPVFNLLSWTTGKAGDALGLMTNYLGIVKAGLTGNQEAVEQYAARIDAAGNALFGMGQQARATGADLEGMTSQAEGATRSLASQIGDALVSAVVRLRGEVKTTDDALKNLGVDPEKIQTGITAAERTIIESFKRIAADKSMDGQVLLGSLLMALDKVSKDGIPEIAFAYKAAARAGRQSADEQVAGLNAVKSAAAGATTAAQAFAKSAEDYAAAVRAQASVEAANVNLKQTAIRLSIEQQRTIYEVAKAKGDSATATAAKNKIVELEIELAALEAKAAIATARATLEEAKAKLAAAEATGKDVTAEKASVAAAEAGLQVAEKKAEITAEVAARTRELAKYSDATAAAIGAMGGAMSGATGAAYDYAGGIDAATAANERLNATLAARSANMTPDNWEQIFPGWEMLNEEQKKAAAQRYNYGLKKFAEGADMSDFFEQLKREIRAIADALIRDSGGAWKPLTSLAGGSSGQSSGGSGDTTTSAPSGGTAGARDSGITQSHRQSGNTYNITLPVIAGTIQDAARLLIPEIERANRFRA